jgi:hypothetical protein
MKKIILWSIVSLVIAGIAVDAFLWLRKPQVITLSGGTKLTLLGATYGKHHVPPKTKIAGRSSRGNDALLVSTNDTLVVWIEAEHKANQYPNYQLLVYDKANTACVSTYSRTQSQVKNGVEIQGFRLDTFPRRDSKMILRVMSYGQRGQQVSKEHFVVSNPARGSFAKWAPDPMPDTQSDGDLSVTLAKLVAGAQLPYNRGNGVAKNDPLNKCVQLGFEIQQKGQSVTNWRPIRVVTSDATGNSIQGWINDFRQNGQPAGYYYQEGLWPDEPAWKLRVEFSRASGFSDDEVWAVTNVPVQPGTQQDVQNAWNSNWNSTGKSKPAFAETTVNGIHLKLFSAIQYQDQNNGGGQSVSFSLKADPDPESSGLRLTVLKATDDQGRELQNRGSSWGGGNYQYQYSGVRNLKTLNLTIALHKSRFVEFTVKPVAAAAKSNQ